MRLRQLKAHLVQIIFAGISLYMIIFLVKDDEERKPKLATRYEQYQDKNKALPESLRGNELALSIVEEIHQNERLRMKAERGKLQSVPRLPQSILDTILAQLPGGKDAIARKDSAAIDAMEALVKNFKDNFTKSNFKPQDLARQFAAHMFDGQKILGPLPDVKKETSFIDAKRLRQNLNPLGGLNLGKALPKDQKLDVEVADAIMQRIQESNPKGFEFVQALQKLQAWVPPPGSVKDLETNALLQKLENTKSNEEGVFNNAQILLKQAQQWSDQQKFSAGHPGDAPWQPEQKSPQNDVNFLQNPKNTALDAFGGSKNPDPSLSRDTFPPVNSPNFFARMDGRNATKGTQGPLPNLQGLQFHLNGGINMHQLLKIKNMMDNGMDVEDIKSRMNLGAPQFIGDKDAAGIPQFQSATSQNGEAKLLGKPSVPSQNPLGDEPQTRQEPAQQNVFIRQERRVGDAEKSEGYGDDSWQDAERNLPQDENNIFMSEQEFDRLIEEQNGGTTKRPDLDFSEVRIVVVDTSVGQDGKFQKVTKLKTVQEYREWKALQYIKKYANPVTKSDTPPTLMPYGPQLLRPNPKSLIKELTMNVQTVEVEENLASEKRRRMKLGDDDILEIPEVKIEVETNPNSIPNIIHFIWFSCHRYRIHHFISMKSALEIHEPRIILLHTNCTPSGAYWDEFTKEAGPKLRIVKRSPPMDIWGQQIEKVEHQSDVARLQILLEVGGIYMDDDMIILKSLDSLRDNSIVMGEENYDALANSILLSNRNAWFLKRWYQEYQSFNGSKWSHSSCFVPWSLWLLFPETVLVVKEKMLRPNWEEIKYLYHELWDWSKNYAVHLYSRFMQALDGTSERSLRELAILNTTYGEISRYILWGDEKARDITDWV